MRARILARTAELCRKALESSTCSCSHVRRGRSLLDRSFAVGAVVYFEAWGGFHKGSPNLGLVLGNAKR